MLLGKADTVFVEKARIVFNEILAPVEAFLAKPAKTVSDLIEGFHSLVFMRRENVKLREENKELIDLVQILLETYKIKETGINLLKESINLVPFIESIIEEVQPIANNSGMTINFESERNYSVMADPMQLTRVIKNLISNAISHSNTTNSIDIKTGELPGYVTISVIDYGQGIPKEEIKMIFNKYYSAVKKFRKIGTGLGLYLSQQIAVSHGGEITVESEENVKTEFCVKLPV